MMFSQASKHNINTKAIKVQIQKDFKMYDTKKGSTKNLIGKMNRELGKMPNKKESDIMALQIGLNFASPSVSDSSKSISSDDSNDSEKKKKKKPKVGLENFKSRITIEDIPDTSTQASDNAGGFHRANAMKRGDLKKPKKEKPEVKGAQKFWKHHRNSMRKIGIS
jgi:hypothetical protein